MAPEDCVAALAGDGTAQLRVAAADRAASVDFPAGYERAAADLFGTSAVTGVGRLNSLVGGPDLSYPRPTVGACSG
jgi:hypothetical protein